MNLTGGPYSLTLTTVSVAHSSETIRRMDFGLVAFFKAWDFSLASNFVIQTVSLCPESFLILVISSFSFFPDGCILLHKNSSIGLESFISGLTFAVIIIMPSAYQFADTQFVNAGTLPTMPGNHKYGNWLPATIVPSQRNVCERYWAANES